MTLHVLLPGFCSVPDTTLPCASVNSCSVLLEERSEMTTMQLCSCIFCYYYYYFCN